MGIYVGQLQEKWQFPSDHLPIGMTLDDYNYLSWNILDAQYMNWIIEKNSQGLSRSMIADKHIYIKNSTLTIRDKHIVDLILQTIFHSTHPRHVFCLQECSKSFIKELRSRLPVHFEFFFNRDKSIFFDQRYLKILKAKEVSGLFTDELYTTLQDIMLRRLDNGCILRLLNVHLPGDPTKPSRFEFGQYLAQTFDPMITTIAMGDMNFNELEITDAMIKAFCNKSPFLLYSPYCTNISPNIFHSKAIDHFLIYFPNKSSFKLNTPDQIMPELAAVAALL